MPDVRHSAALLPHCTVLLDVGGGDPPVRVSGEGLQEKFQLQEVLRPGMG